LDKVPTAADLGAGEKEVLALGMQVPGAVVILDELLGRLHAEALEVTFTGTLGILLRAKMEGRIPRIEPLLEDLDLRHSREMNQGCSPKVTHYLPRTKGAD
jgi:hypothetical protein